MTFINFISSTGGGVSPPPAGLNNLADTITGFGTTPFADGVPICISRDGSTVFAFGYTGSAFGLWVWRWNGTNWPNLQILTFSVSSDFTGWPSTISAYYRYINLCCNEDGSRVYVGLFGSNSNDGAVYAWHESGGTWSEVDRLTPPTGGLAGGFGLGLACDNAGTRIAIGEPFVTHGTAFDNQGQVHVMVESGGSYSLEQTIIDTATDGNGSIPGGSGFGLFCGLSSAGDVLVVGSDRWGNTFAGAGALESHTRSGGLWSYETRRYTSDDTAFEHHQHTQRGIAMSEDASVFLVARADGITGAIYPSTGHYTRSGGAFSYVSTIALGPTGPFFTESNNRASLRMSSDGSFAIYGNFVGDYNGTNDGAIEYWSGPASWASVEDITNPASPDPSTWEIGRNADISGDGAIVVWTSGNNPNPKLVYMKVY